MRLLTSLYGTCITLQLEHSSQLTDMQASADRKDDEIIRHQVLYQLDYYGASLSECMCVSLVANVLNSVANGCKKK